MMSTMKLSALIKNAIALNRKDKIAGCLSLNNKPLTN